MTYELAQELKDAGFPQTGSGRWFHDNSSLQQAAYKIGAIYVPTLSELIEACGENILGLNRTHADDGTPNGWVADTHTHECDCGKSECSGFNWEHETGTTPEEAVARLWLALNKHDQQ